MALRSAGSGGVAPSSASYWGAALFGVTQRYHQRTFEKVFGGGAAQRCIRRTSKKVLKRDVSQRRSASLSAAQRCF